MRADDVTLAAELARIELDRCIANDWEQRAGDLIWSCRRTLDHITDTLLLYAASVAQSARGGDAWAPIRNGNPGVDIPTLLRNLTAGAAILEAVCLGAPAGLRAYHPSGLSDISGFRAMACSEILTHTNDILTGFGRDWTRRPAADLCERVIERVFPWLPATASMATGGRCCCGHADGSRYPPSLALTTSGGGTPRRSVSGMGRVRSEPRPRHGLEPRSAMERRFF